MHLSPIFIWNPNHPIPKYKPANMACIRSYLHVFFVFVFFFFKKCTAVPSKGYIIHSSGYQTHYTLSRNCKKSGFSWRLSASSFHDPFLRLSSQFLRCVFWARKRLANRIVLQSKPTDGIELETRRKSIVQIANRSVFMMVPLMGKT